MILFINYYTNQCHLAQEKLKKIYLSTGTFDQEYCQSKLHDHGTLLNNKYFKE